MSMSTPHWPPYVEELRYLIDQWSGFAVELERKDYTFDLDNWRNDVDVRELIHEALPMFSREEMGDHALKLDEADKAFMAGPAGLQKDRVGHGAAGHAKKTAQ